MKIRNIASLFASVLFVIINATGARAQVQRSFVSGVGSDSNPCSRTAPCRTITHALMGTSAGGEVVVLDSAGYGPFAITQAVSITAPPGVYAGISVFSGDGIDINAGASDTVILRGLTVNNQGSNGNGINFTSGGTLHVEGCVVNGFSNGNGINFGAGANLEVKDSILRANSGGIFVLPMAGTAKATIDQVRLENGGAGLLVRDNSTATVRNSLASGNVIGFAVESGSASSAELDIESCVASNNGTGILASSNSTGVATVRVSNSTVTDNQTGLDNAGAPAMLLSRSNNTVEGNNTDMSGTIGSYTAK